MANNSEEKKPVLHDFPLHVWPARVPAIDGIKVLPADGKHARRGVGGSWDKTNRTATLPRKNDAYHRTIRLHESLHAMYSPAMTPEDACLAGQAVEDAIMHVVHAKTDGAVRRDELTTAMRDLRAAKNPCMLGQSDTALLLALRSLAIIEARGDDEHDEVIASKLFMDAVNSPALEPARKKCEAMGKTLPDVLGRILEHARAEDRQGAREMFKGVMLEEDAPPAKGGKDAGGAGEWPCEVLGGGGYEVDDEREAIAKAVAEVPSEGPEDRKKQRASTLQSDLLSKDVAEMLASARGPWPRQTIRKLFHAVPKKTREGNDSKTAISGIRIRAKKLAVIAVSPVGGRAFEKRLYQRGGAVLIDASGSMGFTPAMLKQIIDILPMGTIAYYSGTDSAAHPDGDLVIYCDKGRMYGGKDLPYRQGGNSIDLPAIQWLLKQPGPRWYIGDQGWCGAAKEYCVASGDLLTNAKAKNMIRHFREVSELLTALRH